MRRQIKSALVTGGAGFIGSHLVDALVAEGCKVIVLDNLSSGNLFNLASVKDQITFLRGDIRNRRILEEAAEGCDVIFHMAAVVSVQQTIDNPVDSAMINDMGSLFVLEAARKKKISRVVFASCCAVYGDDPQLPKKENMDLRPCSPYAVQKFTAEQHMRLYHELYGLETVCLRYFNVYGPRQDSSSPYSGVISIFMMKAVEYESAVIYGDGNQSRDFVYVQDVIKANLLAAMSQKAGGQIFNVGTGSRVRINRLWKMICALSDLKVEAQYQPARPGDIYASVASVEHAKLLLGFEHDYSFDKGLMLTFEWYKQRRNTDSH
jgi:nucleoside-diphosphate-sugar epimerase